MQATAATHATVHQAVKANAKAVSGSALPDFAALLGLALSSSETGQKVESATTTGMQGALAAAAGVALKAGGAAVKPQEKEQATADGTSAALTAMGTGLPTQSSEMAGAAAAQATGTLAVTNAAPAASTTPTPTLRAQPQVAVFGKANTVNDKAAENLAGGAKGEATKAQADRVWNVRELNNQLKSAVSAALSTSLQKTSTADAGNKPQTAAFLTQVQGDKIRAQGTQNLLKQAAEGKGTAGGKEPAVKLQGAAQKLTAQPFVDSGQEFKGAGEKLFAGTDPGLPKAQPEIALAELQTQAPLATEKAADKIAEAATDTDTIASGATPLVWTPEPVAATGTQAAHMPDLNEQVRQVADFLADRTDGAVRLSEKGMDANLKLYPPDMGGVRVQLSVQSDGTAQARFIVERPETAQLLQQHMRSFQQGLESHGLSVSSVKVTLQGTTVQPASSSAGSGWSQEPSQEFRGRNSLAGERGGENPKRQGRGPQEKFED